ncbi:hypothetical protein YPPY89_2753, partial [Yersinia pestis PY-89]
MLLLRIIKIHCPGVELW